MSNSGPVLSVYLVYIKHVRFWPKTDQFYPKMDKSETFFRYNLSTCTEMWSENVPHFSNFVSICSQGCLIWLQIGCDWLKMGQIWDFYKCKCFLARRSKMYWKTHHKQSQIWGKSCLCVCLYKAAYQIWAQNGPVFIPNGTNSKLFQIRFQYMYWNLIWKCTVILQFWANITPGMSDSAPNWTRLAQNGTKLRLLPISVHFDSEI